MRRLFPWLFVTAIAIFSATTAVALRAQADTAARSTRDGVYTDAQAERGRMVFEGICTDCHQPAMWGDDWDGKSVGDIFAFISQNMPEPAPGSLSSQQIRDVIAFFLRSNQLPAGERELPAAVNALNQIRLERP
jgi:mono/diheme cytochrome c family protein